MKKIKGLLISALALTALSGMSVSVALASQTESLEWVDILWGQNECLERELPDGLQGKSYPVPECYATDNLGNVLNGLEVLVVDPEGKLVPIVDGRFSTSKLGTYEIQYNVEYLNYKAEKIISVNVLPKCDQLYYTMSEEIGSSYNTGSVITLYDGEYGGGLGDLKVNCTVFKGSEEYAVSDFGGYKCFIPKTEGEYTVSFSVSDFVANEVTEQISINVVNSTKPIMREPSIRLTNRLNQKVDLPVVDAVQYTQNGAYLVPVEVTFDGNDISDTMSYIADEAGEHVIEYVAYNFDRTESTKYTYNIEVIDVNADIYTNEYHYINNYFYTENCEDVFTENGFEIVADGSSDTAYMMLSAKIDTEFINFTFGANYQKNNYEGIRFYLTDSAYKDQVVELYFTRGTEYTDVYLNGKFVANVRYSLDELDTENSTYSLRFDINNNTFVNSNGDTVCTVASYANGTKFTGFSSGSAYLSMEIVGITGESAVAFFEAADTTVSSIDYEVTNPLLSGVSQYESVMLAEINENLTIPYLKFFDILDENISLNLTIINPDGEIVFNENITEDIKFTFTSYGTYALKYTASDSHNNYSELYATVNVQDRVFPKISVKGVKDKFKVDEEYTLPQAVVSDNYTKDCTVYVYVIDTENNIFEVLFDMKYTFKKQGEYIFRYVVADEAANVVSLDFKVVCR